jgi:hypothetical protein
MCNISTTIKVTPPFAAGKIVIIIIQEWHIFFIKNTLLDKCYVVELIMAQCRRGFVLCVFVLCCRPCNHGSAKMMRQQH